MDAQYLIEKLNQVKANHPELASRYQRGIEIYRAPARVVEMGPDDEPGNNWLVTTAPGPKHRHTVHETLDRRGLTCSCADYQYDAPQYGERRYCKHVIAVELLRHHGPFPTPAKPFITRKLIMDGDPTPAGIYGNGHQIEPELSGDAQVYRERTGRQPADHEALINWIYR